MASAGRYRGAHFIGCGSRDVGVAGVSGAVKKGVQRWEHWRWRNREGEEQIDPR